MPELLDLDSAIKLLSSIVIPINEVIERSIEDSLGYVTAYDITAPYCLPPFDNTSVDGYAFRHEDCHDQKSMTLNLAGESAAGHPFKGNLPPGSAVRIATGAMLPEGANTVVMQENCTISGKEIFVKSVPENGANIRYAGADVEQGAVVLPARHLLRPQDVALLMALGYMSVSTIRPLRVALLSTGSELRMAGDKLGGGEIIDTNSLMLCQLLGNLPVTVTRLPKLIDDYQATEKSLAQAALGHDLVISTGGVSVGDHDHVRDSLKALGKIHFWKLAIRPGKPVMLGQIKECFMLGLPGNPVSAFVTFSLMARPLLNALWGQMPQLPPAFFVLLGQDIKTEKTLRCFPRARLEVSNQITKAFPYKDQSSNLITSLVQADGILDLAPGRGEFSEGANVLFRPFT